MRVEGEVGFRGDLKVKIKRGGWRRFNPFLWVKDFFRSIWL